MKTNRTTAIALICLFIPVFSVWGGDYPLLRPDRATKQSWIESYRNAPRAFIDPSLKPKKGSLSLLSSLQYTPSQRDQGSCGNCWAWAGTGCLAIALQRQESIKDRLSIQYINSCQSSVIGKSCCEGGWLYDVVNFYSSVGAAVPWSNSNASWQDDDGSCHTVCGSVSTSPNYPITSINYTAITTHGVGQTTAVNNIKNVLNQGKAVWFGFFMSTTADWTSFENFWDYNSESTLWDFDSTCGKTPDYGQAGHAVLCVGYNDDDPDHSYWIMLNSWGTPSGRPNGLFRVDMDMDYDCAEGGFWGDYNHYWQALDVTFGGGAVPTPTPDAGGGGGDTFQSPHLVSLNYSGSGSTSGYFNDYHTYDGWIDGETGPDTVYSFTLTGRAPLNISLTNLSGDLDIFLCNSPSVNSVYDYSINSYFSSESISIASAPAGTYYLVIDGWNGAVSSFDLSITSSAAPTPPPQPTPAPGTVGYPGDYNGDGYDDISIFRPSSGLWAIRSVTRVYYGATGDIPAPGDYNGDLTTDIAVFRPPSALWAIRGISRYYFGAGGDFLLPSDYDGDGTYESAVYRDGLWAVRNLTRSYFGTSGDLPVIR